MYSFKRTIIIAVLGNLALIFCYNYYMMLPLMLIIGFSIGGEISLGGTIVNEYVPPSKEQALTFLTIFWWFGAQITAIIVLIIYVSDP